MLKKLIVLALVLLVPAGLLFAGGGAEKESSKLMAIMIEPPAGSPTRNEVPFHHNIPNTEKSLTWLFLGINKRWDKLEPQTPQ